MVFVISIYIVGSLNGNFVNEEYLGDYEDYVFLFDEKTVEGKKIVLFDNRGIQHVQYYVLEFTGEQYIYYTYYFVGNHDEYVKKYALVKDKVVDYNYDNYMIKTIERIDTGTYYDLMEELIVPIENDIVYLVY